MRIAIIGWPGTGKTTLGKQLAEQLGVPYRSTDEVKDLGWSESSLEVSKWFDQPNWVIEGVALPRALRKWSANNPGQPPPVDKIIHLKTQYRELEKGAISMGKGIDTVLNEIRPWLGEIEVRS
jgi:dephospho-CoA kinase